MIAIPNMEKPKECKKCEIFLWCYTTDWKGYEHCPLIDIVRCGECKWWDKADRSCDIRDSYGWEYKPTDFCSYGERRTDYTVFTVNTPKGIETPLKGDATVFHKNSKMGEKVARPTATSSTEVPWWKGE